MPGIGGMDLAPDHVPRRRLERGEERVRIRDHGVDMGQVHPFGSRQARDIDFAAADHAQLRCVVGIGDRDGLLDRPHRLHAIEWHLPGPRQHQVAPAGQRPSQRLGGLAAHQQWLAQGQRLEASEIVGEAPRKRVAAPDRAVPVERGDQHQRRHPATLMLIPQPAPGSRDAGRSLRSGCRRNRNRTRPRPPGSAPG